MFPFHLSLFVENLENTKSFYLENLGASLGREPEDWLDIILFDHQLTFHQAKKDQKVNPLDHFGVVLSREKWSELATRLKSSGTRFLAEPALFNEGTDDEFGKLLILDPDNNILEFKFYLSFNRTVKSST